MVLLLGYTYPVCKSQIWIQPHVFLSPHVHQPSLTLVTSKITIILSFSISFPLPYCKLCSTRHGSGFISIPRNSQLSSVLGGFANAIPFYFVTCTVFYCYCNKWHKFSGLKQSTYFIVPLVSCSTWLKSKCCIIVFLSGSWREECLLVFSSYWSHSHFLASCCLPPSSKPVTEPVFLNILVWWSCSLWTQLRKVISFLGHRKLIQPTWITQDFLPSRGL